ncbi:uncharacterized protein LOC121076615 [Cygnus olor]|uniref:uncharacterized protein LOC121076615 n=1 Tax=Cygnus olor TaxID=8869 RepID=UPI001ADE3F76|nr:uncharacterized protein LOC121076615 [Cygnus olor]
MRANSARETNPCGSPKNPLSPLAALEPSVVQGERCWKGISGTQHAGLVPRFAPSRHPVRGMHPTGSPVAVSVARPSLPMAIRGWMRAGHGDCTLKNPHIPDKGTSHPQSAAALQPCASSRDSSKQRVSGRLSLGSSSQGRRPPAAALGPCGNLWPGWQRGEPLPFPGEAAQTALPLQKQAAAWRGEGKPRRSTEVKPKLSFPGSCFTSWWGLVSPALPEIENGLLQAKSHGCLAAGGRLDADGGSTSASCPSRADCGPLGAQHRAPAGRRRQRDEARSCDSDILLSAVLIERNLRFPKLSI